MEEIRVPLDQDRAETKLESNSDSGNKRSKDCAHMQNIPAWLEAHLTLWTLVGLFGQALFMMRFIVQWIASERAKQSVMPEIFWYFSLGGGLIVFVYSVHQQDLVFMLGQGLGVFIYLRNIYFIRKRARAANA
jgi:lipid-A-disaccharide synthase-like uncharacterized protein